MLHSIKMVCKFQDALFSTLHHACVDLVSEECCAYAIGVPGLELEVEKVGVRWGHEFAIVRNSHLT